MEINTQNVPKVLWLAIACLVIAFLALTVIDKANGLSRSFNARPDNTISMSAEGKVSAVPDLATVTVGVTTQAATAKAASDEVTAKANKITEFVKQQGIDSKDITTSNFSVYPNQDYSSGTQKIIGYQANETVIIKVRGIDKSADKVGKILGGAVLEGSNQIQGIYFSFDDPDNLRQEARKIAIEKAKQKAQDLASASGLRLGRVVSVSESSSGYPVSMPYAIEGRGGMEADAKSVANVEPGSQDITAQMTLVFELK